MTVKVECDNKDCGEDIKNQEGSLQVIEGEVVMAGPHESIEQDEYHGVFCSRYCMVDELVCSCQNFDEGCDDCIDGLRVKRG